MITKNTPILDLHGEVSDIAKVLINEFIEDCYKTKKKEAVIVHGIGKNILQKATKDTLKKNKYVEDFKLDNFNIGQTIVKLKSGK